MRYPALEYQPGIAAEQLSPLAPPREPRPPPQPTPNARQGRASTRALDKPTSISAGVARRIALAMPAVAFVSVLAARRRAGTVALRVRLVVATDLRFRPGRRGARADSHT